MSGWLGLSGVGVVPPARPTYRLLSYVPGASVQLEMVTCQAEDLVNRRREGQQEPLLC